MLQFLLYELTSFYCSLVSWIPPLSYYDIAEYQCFIIDNDNSDIDFIKTKLIIY